MAHKISTVLILKKKMVRRRKASQNRLAQIFFNKISPFSKVVWGIFD